MKFDKLTMITSIIFMTSVLSMPVVFSGCSLYQVEYFSDCRLEYTCGFYTASGVNGTIIRGIGDNFLWRACYKIDFTTIGQRSGYCKIGNVCQQMPYDSFINNFCFAYQRDASNGPIDSRTSSNAGSVPNGYYCQVNYYDQNYECRNYFAPDAYAYPNRWTLPDTWGRWDASEKGCVKCSGNKETAIYWGAGTGMQDTNRDRCEVGCGADSRCDEQTPRTGNCTINCIYVPCGNCLGPCPSGTTLQCTPVNGQCCVNPSIGIFRGGGGLRGRPLMISTAEGLSSPFVIVAAVIVILIIIVAIFSSVKMMSKKKR